MSLTNEAGRNLPPPPPGQSGSGQTERHSLRHRAAECRCHDGMLFIQTEISHRMLSCTEPHVRQPGSRAAAAAAAAAAASGAQTSPPPPRTREKPVTAAAPAREARLPPCATPRAEADASTHRETHTASYTAQDDVW